MGLLYAASPIRGEANRGKSIKRVPLFSGPIGNQFTQSIALLETPDQQVEIRRFLLALVLT